nr:hypothetical protein [Bailinhaonella thermotolerans]
MPSASTTRATSGARSGGRHSRRAAWAARSSRVSPGSGARSAVSTRTAWPRARAIAAASSAVGETGRSRSWKCFHSGFSQLMGCRGVSSTTTRRRALADSAAKNSGRSGTL